MPMSNNGFSKLAEETGELQQVIGKVYDAIYDNADLRVSEIKAND